MFRTLQLALATSRPRRPVPGLDLLDESTTRMRVNIGDLDLYRHVNNGVYLQMMDVARINFIADLGLMPELGRRGWYPVVANSTMYYRRSLTLGQRFEIRTRLLGWDDRCVFIEQTFHRGDEQIVRGVVAGRFLARDHTRVSGADVAAAAGHTEASPALPADVTAWAAAFDILHRPR
ncbi:acyl-CoA thioesterase [Sanguibacter sp. A247]|uniref:acyl-CoA thioesterase n=1 Tax=unclassified Sanguibacter TaxID=2645534 RepID=UPI003FD6D8CD